MEHSVSVRDLSVCVCVSLYLRRLFDNNILIFFVNFKLHDGTETLADGNIY